MPNQSNKRSQKMPPDAQDENTWQLAVWLHDNAPVIYAALAAMSTAALRTYLDTGRITGRDICEWLICGIFVVSSRPLWPQMGLGDEYGAFIGVTVGMLGARLLRVSVEAIFGKLIARIGGK